MADVPRIEAVMFGPDMIAIDFTEPRNRFKDGGYKTEHLVIPTAGREDLVNEILEDVLSLLDEYLAEQRDPPKQILGRE